MSEVLNKSFEEVSVKFAYPFNGADDWVHDIILRLYPVREKEDAWQKCPYAKWDEKDRLRDVYREECVRILSYIDENYGGCDAIYKRMEADIRQRAVQYQVPMEKILAQWKLGVRGKHRECEMPIAQIDALRVGMDHSYGHALHYLDFVMKERDNSQPAIRNE